MPREAVIGNWLLVIGQQSLVISCWYVASALIIVMSIFFGRKDAFKSTSSCCERLYQIETFCQAFCFKELCHLGEHFLTTPFSDSDLGILDFSNG